MRVLEIKREWDSCRKCPLAKTRRHVVSHRGNPKADIMLIGEAPGRDEDRIGQPFVGKSGKILDQALRMFDLENDVFITNTVACRPCDEPDGPNRAPLKAETLACRPRLVQMLNAVRPKLVIAVGQVAVRALFKRAAPLLPARHHGAMIGTVLHPAALFYGDSNEREYRTDQFTAQWKNVLRLYKRNGAGLRSEKGWELPLG